MPQQLIDFSAPIIAAYQAGKAERLARERFAAEREDKRKQLELAEKELEAQNKRAEAQLKATMEFHKATAAHQTASLAQQTAAQQAQAAATRLGLKLRTQEMMAKGEIPVPTKQVFPSDTEFNPEFLATGDATLADSAMARNVPVPLNIGEGITLQPEEFPEVYSDKMKQEDLFKKSQQQWEEQFARLLKTQEGSEERLRIAEEGRNVRHKEDIAAMLAATQMRTGTSGGPNSPYIDQMVRGQVPITPTLLKKHAKEFQDYVWTKYNKEHPDDPSVGFYPRPVNVMKDLRDASNSKVAVEYAFEYAEALDRWTKSGFSKEHLPEVIRIARDAERLLPQLKQGASLGVLSERDLNLLKANLPDVTGAITEQVMKNLVSKNAKTGQSWGMQRAISLAKRYQLNLNSLIGDVPAGQRDYEINDKYKLGLRLKPEHRKALGW